MPSTKSCHHSIFFWQEMRKKKIIITFKTHKLSHSFGHKLVSFVSFSGPVVDLRFLTALLCTGWMLIQFNTVQSYVSCTYPKEKILNHCYAILCEVHFWVKLNSKKLARFVLNTFRKYKTQAPVNKKAVLMLQLIFHFS